MKWYSNLIFLLIYTLGYTFLVFGTLADGHGTFLFVSPLVAWVIFVISFFLLPHIENKTVLIIVLALIGLYYATSLLIAVVEQFGSGNFQRTRWLLDRNPGLFVSTCLWYLVGQVAFWVLFIRKLRRPETLP